MAVSVVTVLTIIMGLTIGLSTLNFGPQDEPSFSPPSPSRLGKYKTAAVSSDGVPCSEIGRCVNVQYESEL